MLKEDRKLVATVVVVWVAVFVAIGFVVWHFVDMDNYYEQQQKNQEACLNAGGMYIDNKNTEPYCFFNK